LFVHANKVIRVTVYFASLESWKLFYGEAR